MLHVKCHVSVQVTTALPGESAENLPLFLSPPEEHYSFRTNYNLQQSILKTSGRNAGKWKDCIIWINGQ